MTRARTYLRRALWSLVPSNSPLIYRLAKRYVDLYNDENNDDIETNGEFRLMQRNLPECETIFDIGANVGLWTTLALRIKPTAHIHCFEPSRNAFQRLLSNRFPPNVVCNNFGMSSAPGKAKLYLFDEGSGINSLYQRQGLESFGLSTQQREETITLGTVDHYCLERGIQAIDFAKVDVEGHELEVFKGMTRMLRSRQVRIIQFEYGGCNIDAGVLLKDIFAFFKSFSYTFYKIFPKGLKPVVKYDQRFENFQYQNWAIIKNGDSSRN
jgi:FkbM family methyltransferase